MITEIKLKNFRLFEDISFKTNNSLIIFSGKNAVGKTSILEGIYLCGTSKSHRDNDVTNIIKDGYDYASVEINDEKKYRVFISNDTKSYFINKAQCKRVSDFIGDLRLVLFSPYDLNLIDGTKSIRRRFLDLEISLVDKECLRYLSNYKKLLNERNEALKSKSIDKTIINVITDELINNLLVVYKKRIDFINSMNELLIDISMNLGLDTIRLEYESSYNPNDIKKSFDQKLERDLLTKTTNIGIHRDDFKILLNDKDASIYASNGQKHLICIAIKLALKEYIKTKCNEEPILLLDDVFQSLDKEKIRKLTEYVKKSKQAFITTTSILDIPDEILKDALVLRIENNKEKVNGKGN